MLVKFCYHFMLTGNSLAKLTGQGGIYSFLGTGGGVLFLESSSCRVFFETATVALSETIK